ncbi:MAG: hypothetical protein ACXAC5_03555 [Promethearchaeota archaeon]|jgi:hypothetical protein
MIDAHTLQICDGLSVCVSCYEKIRRYLSGHKWYLCHICFRSCIRYDYDNLRWIGDEQVSCCGNDECEEQIRQADRLYSALRENDVGVPDRGRDLGG